MKSVTTSLSVGLFLFLTIIFHLNSLYLAKEFLNPVSVSAKITPSTFTLGDIATYTITVQHDRDIQPTIPNIKQLKGLEFLKNSSVTGKDTNEFISIIGADDTFIDAEVLKNHIPQLKIIKGEGHSHIPLLNKLAK